MESTCGTEEYSQGIRRPSVVARCEGAVSGARVGGCGRRRCVGSLAEGSSEGQEIEGTAKGTHSEHSDEDG